MASSKRTKVIAEYIWVQDNCLHSKARTISIQSLDELEVKNIGEWHFMNGDEKVKLVPINIFNCPFRGQNAVLVFCKTPNTKVSSKKSSGLYKAEQEYYIINPNLMRPYGFPTNVKPDLSINYNSSVGLDKSYGRKMADLHYKLCIATGINMTELRTSNSPAQWRYTVEGNTRNDLCVHLWLSRYILLRVGEISNVIMDFSSKVLDDKIWYPSKCCVDMNGEVTEYDGSIDLYEV